MPAGVYLRTEKHKMKISEGMKGHFPSSIFKKDCIPINKGKKCPQISETRKRLFRNGGKVYGFKKGHAVSPELIKRIGLANSIRMKGHIPWNKGKKIDRNLYPNMGNFKLHSIETKYRISRTKAGKSWSESRKKAQQLAIRKINLKPVIKNGKEYHPYWDNIRKVIYKRDNWICQECESHCHNETKIQCHHIDGNVNNNNPSNLITLCASCHAKVTFRKKDWVKYFNSKMELKLSWTSPASRQT